MPSVLTCALISRDVYNSTSSSVVGYHPVAIPEAKRWNNSNSNFFGAAYFGGDIGVIAFRGSQEAQDFTDADFDIARMRLPINQLGDAFAFFSDAEKALSQYGSNRIVVVGHSLGGGLAEIVAARISRIPVTGVTFNAPGLMAFTRAGPYASLNIPKVNDRIVNIRSEEDRVSLWGHHIAPLHTVRNGGWHPIGPLIEALLTDPIGVVKV